MIKCCAHKVWLSKHRVDWLPTNATNPVVSDIDIKVDNLFTYRHDSTTFWGIILALIVPAHKSPYATIIPPGFLKAKV